MKLLIICPKLPNMANKAFDLPENPLGGWIDGMVKNLSSSMELTVLFPNNSLDEAEHIVDGVSYYRLHTNSEKIKELFEQNDIVHIIGIEHWYIAELMPVIPFEKTILNITGLKSECAKVYMNDIHTLNPLLYANMKYAQNDFKAKGRTEIELLKKCRYVTGRTEWDKGCALGVNPDIRYFSCNESLRDIFYTSNKWNINDVNKRQVFISQASYPIKGGHKALEVVDKLKSIYPDIQVYIAGENMMNADSLLTKLNSSYASYLRNYIVANKLEDTVHFTGNLGAVEMVECMLKSHVFLLTSTLENGSNSIQEAMMLGVPCVASKVGGIPSLWKGSPCRLFDFEDKDKAVELISEIFEMDDEKIMVESKEAIEFSSKISDRENNAKTMLEIHEEIYRDLKSQVE